MARSKRNYEEAIEELQLKPGASIEQIKNAYRKLAKHYHPDVYKLDDGERFKEISAAFNFLKKNPEQPAQNQTYQASGANDYERRRRAHQQQKQKKEADEAIRKAEMFQWLFARLRLFAFIILIFNSLLLVDYILPSETEEVKISRINTLKKFSRYSSEKANLYYSYSAELTNGMSFKFEKEGIKKIDLREKFILERSMIFRQAERLISQKTKAIIYNEYGLFRIFGFLIPIAIVLIVSYFFVKNNDYRLTIFLIAAAILMVQLVLVF